MKYILSYSGSWEGTRSFRKILRLRKFIKNIPDYEIRNTFVAKRVKNYWLVGQFYKLKNGNISIKF